MSLWKVNAISESTPGSGVTVTGLIATNPTVTLPSGGDADLTTATLGWIFASGVSKAIGLARLGGYIARLFGFYIVTDPKFGATGDGTTDDTAAIQAAVTAAFSGSIVYFPHGTYKVTGTLSVGVRDLIFQGTGPNGCVLQYYGNSFCIQLGTDDGLSLDSGSYNGVAQGFVFRDMKVQCLNSGAVGQLRTALLNSISGNFYGTSSVGIMDWRCGYVQLTNAYLSGFEYAFKGYQSDVSAWQKVVMNFNHVAVLLGAESNQCTFDHIWTAGNDTVWILEGCEQTRVQHWTSDTDGSGTTAPVIVRNSATAVNARYATTRTCANIVFDQPWCEQMGSLGTANPGYDVTYFFDLHSADTTQSGGVVIRSPMVRTNAYSDGTKPHFFYLVRAGYLTFVEVTNLSGFVGGVPWSNMKGVFAWDVAATTTAKAYFSDADMHFGSRIGDNFNALSATLQIRSDGSSDTYLINQLGGSGAINIGSLGLRRQLHGNSVPMTSGVGGDAALNSAFGAGKSFGWMYTGATAVVLHAPTIASDRGDAAVTLTPETDFEEQNFSTALTVDRDCVLAAPPNVAHGYRFRIKRGGAGAFNLNVKNLTSGGTVLKAMPAASWAEFMYDGSSWSLRAYGLL